jgi:hypothetical protein
MKNSHIDSQQNTAHAEKRDKKRFRDYMKNFMTSAHHHVSRGAEEISRMIRSAHKDNWRRGREKKK